MKSNPRFGSSIYDNPVEKCVEYALTHGLTHFEINLTPGHSHIHTFTRERILLLRNLAQQHDFTFSFHLPSSTNLSHYWGYLRRMHMGRVIQCIQTGAQLGVTHLTIHLGSFGGHTIMHYFRRGAIRKIVQSLKTLVDICKNKHIKLALENSAKLHAGSDIEMLGDNIDDFKKIFKEIDSPWLGFCLDIGHANTNEGALDYIRHLNEKIICVHFHDNYGLYDEHLEIGDGSVNWTDIMSALKKINYTGPFISECFKTSPHHAVALFIDQWEKL